MRTNTQSITLSQFKRIVSPYVESHRGTPIRANATSVRSGSLIHSIGGMNWSHYVIYRVHSRLIKDTPTPRASRLATRRTLRVGTLAPEWQGAAARALEHMVMVTDKIK